MLNCVKSLNLSWHILTSYAQITSNILLLKLSDNLQVYRGRLSQHHQNHQTITLVCNGTENVGNFCSVKPLYWSTVRHETFTAPVFTHYFFHYSVIRKYECTTDTAKVFKTCLHRHHIHVVLSVIWLKVETKILRKCVTIQQNYTRISSLWSMHKAIMY